MLDFEYTVIGRSITTDYVYRIIVYYKTMKHNLGSQLFEWCYIFCIFII